MLWHLFGNQFSQFYNISDFCTFKYVFILNENCDKKNFSAIEIVKLKKTFLPGNLQCILAPVL